MICIIYIKRLKPTQKQTEVEGLTFKILPTRKTDKSNDDTGVANVINLATDLMLQRNYL